MEPFSLGRTHDTVRLRIHKRVILQGSLHLPGELISVAPADADLLLDGYADRVDSPATPSKSLDAPVRDRMQGRPIMKKGSHEQ